MARSALLFLLLLGSAAADTACPGGACPADADEHSALLQHRAATTTKALGCTDTPAATCGNPDIMCVMDTENCTASGGGYCCKAAGDVDGMLQCRFCGGGCEPCPPAPASTTTTTTGTTAKACCKAATAECYACEWGVSEAQVCEWYPEMAGCPKPCCKAATAECYACEWGVSEAQVCEWYPEMAGCPKPCCKAATAECYACEWDVSEAQVCEWYPEMAGCPACSQGDLVTCPNEAQEQCMGNQCCSGTPASGSLTFPCPSASDSFAGCQSNTKLATCDGTSALVEVKKHTVVCSTGDHVTCPNEAKEQCAGDQCCRRTPASGNLTFPCPSASDSFAGCENNTKLATCNGTA